MNTHNIHDGRELEMLLSGKKPLAVFSRLPEIGENTALGDQGFERAVAEGYLTRFDNTFEFEGKEIRYIAFTPPSESWRAQAYFLLKKFMFERSWCSHLEWIEGSLLGYSDDENLAHIRQKYKTKGVCDKC